MAIDPSLLISSNDLQQALVDKTGIPMSAGVITCYRDDSRSILKNWYYQIGTAGNYSYIALPNPLTLSGAGTVCDSNGVDVIPFFYPYDESDSNTAQPYYITIVNSAATNQITRSNFPFLNADSGGGGVSSSAEENYIVNNVFWRNLGTLNASSYTTNTEICPSQNSGFQYPNITFVKNKTGATDTISFPKFALLNEQTLENDPTPEYYLNHTCSVATTGETTKDYYFPISLHLLTTSALPSATITVQAYNGGSGDADISLFLYQDTGTGGTPSDPVETSLETFSLGNDWTKYQWSGVLPGTEGLTLGSNGNDALYLIIRMPLNATCNINFTKPSFYLADAAPTNSFQTYQEIDSVIAGPSLGNVLLNVVKLTSSSGTYTPTSGTHSIVVQAVSGGGGGAGSVSNATQVGFGSGGAGGACGVKYFSTIGSSYAYTIGSGGVAGTSGTSYAGGTGGNTSFSSGATLINLSGGVGGSTSQGSYTSGSQVYSQGGSAAGGHADTGDTCDIVYPGQPGGTSFYVSFGSSNGTGYGGVGGAAGNGSGGSASGTPTGYGGGGFGSSLGWSGGTAHVDGNAGAPGYILIYEYAQALTSISYG